MRILIAEDDLVSRRVLQKFLEKWGHEVVTAGDGAEAWERFQAEEFSVVISDWMMPEMTGLELVKRIRAHRRPGYVYVVMVTAKSGRASLVEGLEAGADDFLNKPFDHEELRVRLRTAERIVQLEAGLAERNRLLESANADLEAANHRMRHDLEAAAKVQRALLPPHAPHAAGVRFGWIFEPCDELAGDLLNVVRLDEHHLAVYVLDVSGHGVAAALLSVIVGQAVARLADPDSAFRRRVAGSGDHPAPPAEVARELYRLFPFDPATGQYFTIAFATLDERTRELRCVSAGHPRPIHVPAGAAPAILPVGGFPIGLLEGRRDVEYHEARLTLAPGDRLLMYSDGLTEAMNAQRDVFGDDRLLAALAETRGAPLQDGLSELVARSRAWSAARPVTDDVSLLGLEIE